MRLTRVEDEYPGYQRRMFECPGCGGTMTEWAGSIGRLQPHPPSDMRAASRGF